MGGKQSKAKQVVQQKPQKEQWEEDWEVFLSSHPGFTPADVDWEEKVAGQGDKDNLRLVCISDTHCQVYLSLFRLNFIHEENQAETMLEPVPEGDILIHAGDFTNYGRREEVEKFNTWLGTLPHR